MGLCVLFGLLGVCLAFYREGVWTPYSTQDIARWQAQTKPLTPSQPIAELPADALPQKNDAGYLLRPQRPAPPVEVKQLERVA
ncbi:hypothetical protein GCM10023172_00290 [Hymenobacter ginsengisoli]|uniref:Uncharacterized protein n=1 Tax=Hymenobacter ginsengisoli TaxID=1051626 RepID=A0ABP8PWC3_9BACT